MAIYSPLSCAANGILQLRLHPGTQDAQLKCTPSQVSIHLHYNFAYIEWGAGYEKLTNSEVVESCQNHHPVYEDLSYDWGQKSSRCPIEINNQAITISSNLSSALQRLRNSDKDRVLWVDTLCINQEDMQRRGSQVQRMTAIYQRAERVLI